jgi:hypothetical protein
MEKKFEMRKKYVLLALRANGYSNNTAIADIIDNSLETDVNAKNINVAFDLQTSVGNKKSINTISIVDDGCGMTIEQLIEAMALGSETKKDDTTLGKYGTGMKTAALSMGRCLSVYTKTNNGELLLAQLDLDYENEEGDICVKYSRIGSETNEYKNFIKQVNGEHGTIVAISKLDQLTSLDFDTFKERHLKYLRLYFNKFIEEDKVNLYFNNEKMGYYDVIGQKSGFGTENLHNGEFLYKGIITKYKIWYMPQYKGWSKLSREKVTENYLGRSTTTQGLYIYRNNRLVGWGLNLGVIANTVKDYYYNGFRVELFLDGSSDSIFGTTFSKMITEKDKSLLDSEYLDILKEEINEYRIWAYQQGRREQKNKEESDTPEEVKEVFNKVVEAANDNIFLSDGMSNHGKNEKKDEHKSKNPNPKKQEHPNPIRKRFGTWFGGFEFDNDMSSNELMYYPKKRNNLYYIVINPSHVYYKEFFSKLSEAKQYECALMLAASIKAKSKLGYFDDGSEFRQLIDDYEEKWSDCVKAAYKEAE